MNLVTYFRVSTSKQGMEGLGMEAQQALVERYVRAHADANVVASFVEVESGTKNDRPELQKALTLAKATGATLAVAKMDRLARNAHFLLGILESGVEIVDCSNPHINRLTMGILAVVAEEEARLISQRTKAALAEAKKRGKALGMAQHSADVRQRAAAASATTRSKAADAFAAQHAPRALQMRARGLSLRQVAAEFQDRNIPTPRKGSRWHETTIRAILQRYEQMDLAV